MVILHRKNVPSMSRTLKDLAEDPRFLEAAEKIQKNQKSLLHMMYEIN
jgi:hypothetical protein